jgi:hypothetical protein
MKMDGPKTPTAVHGPLGITYHPNGKAKAFAGCLEDQFIFNDQCDESHKRQV